ncbi:YugN family protein [Alkalicoccobacillus porphyridii]|uniref:YugN-like family protein n=1 Tax=Alkalicoccobacillus porphyridii TaxID=2597270 RepID=A0A553ZXW5_9BACI|nr:YugN family protein [Alkalicoccobacillus porphyridii]TSB46297.1 hypothetical protein FN960_10825 [Alkalicoccobacillus porphyridii]
MKFDEIGFEGQEVKFSHVRHAAEASGFVLAEQWDYERATFDYKILNQGDTYYLRVPAYSIKGDIPTNDAICRLMSPVLGKHYYPHGVEYEGESFPESVINRAHSKLDLLKHTLEQEA